MNGRSSIRLGLGILVGLLWLAVRAPGVWANAAPPEAAAGASPKSGAESTRVQMVRERVVLTLDPDGQQATVEGLYIMRNTGAQAETMEVLYPLMLLFSECLEYRFTPPKRIAQLQIWVDEQPVSFDIRQGAPVRETCTEPIPWAAFRVTFPPGEEVRLRVRYRQETWGYPPYLILTYILETGAGWYGPIQEGEILVQMPYPVSEDTVVLHADLGYAQSTTPGAQLEGSTVRWTFHNLEPTPEDNIFLLFMSPAAWQDIEQWRSRAHRNPKRGDNWGFLGLAIKRALLLYGMYFREDAADLALSHEGLEAYRKAVTLKPSDPDWHFGYGQFLVYLADVVQDPAQRADYLYTALQEFQEALRLDPEHEKTLAFLNDQDNRTLYGWVKEFDGTFRFLGLTVTPTFLPTLTPTPTPRPRRTRLPSPTPYPVILTDTPSPTASSTLLPTFTASPSFSPSPTASSSHTTALGWGVWMLLGCGLVLVLVVGGIVLFLQYRKRTSSP